MPVIIKSEEEIEPISEKKSESLSSAEFIEQEEANEKEVIAQKDIITEITTENVKEELEDAEKTIENENVSSTTKSSISSSISSSSLTDEISAKTEKVGGKIKSKVPKFFKKKLSKEGDEKEVVAEFKTGRESIDEEPENEPTISVKSISRTKSNYDSSLLIKLDRLKLSEKCSAGSNLTLKVREKSETFIRYFSRIFL